ncbi:MAG: hypothetical protein GX786_08080 [Clostridiales bacterium]|nr:hypothetical protein [Clostridiales bacterium]
MMKAIIHHFKSLIASTRARKAVIKQLEQNNRERARRSKVIRMRHARQDSWSVKGRR